MNTGFSGRIAVFIFGLCLLACSKEENVSLEAIKIHNPALNMLVGDTEQIVADAVPAEATGEFNWYSVNTNVVTVSATGLATAVSAGKTEIIVSRGQVRKSVTVIVTNREIPLTDILVVDDTVHAVVGNEVKIQATPVPEDATGLYFQWESENESIVKVNGAGRISAVAPGTAKVTVSQDNIRKTVVVEVIAGIHLYSRDDWSIKYYSSSQAGEGSPQNVLNDDNSYWATPWDPWTGAPHSIVLDLGGVKNMTNVYVFRLMPHAHTRTVKVYVPAVADNSLSDADFRWKGASAGSDKWKFVGEQVYPGTRNLSDNMIAFDIDSYNVNSQYILFVFPDAYWINGNGEVLLNTDGDNITITSIHIAGR
jgi:hypothetical protein